jgi:hypothetical protein
VAADRAAPGPTRLGTVRRGSHLFIAEEVVNNTDDISQLI